MEKTHTRNIFTKKSECGEKGKTSINVEEINCIDCLNLDKKEWKRQVSKFKGYPLRNAKKGLRMVKDRIKQLNSEVRNSSQA